MVNNLKLHTEHLDTGGMSTLVFILIWAGYLLLSPFYIFNSGLPQPADMLLVFGVLPALILAAINFKGRISAMHISGALFVILTLCINLIYFLYIGDRSFVPPSLFYVFNFGVFLFIIYLFKRAPQLMNRVTYLVISAIILMQLVYVIGVSPDGGRHQGTFNNPNQLAYWSLLMSVMIIVLKRGASINLFDLILFSALAFLQSEALSKAGMISYGVLLVFVAFQPATNKKLKALFVFGLFAFFITEITAPQQVKSWVIAADNISAVMHRLGKIGVEVDDSPMARGYSRLIEYPEYILVGAGEGAHWRFNARQELHSGLATILFSYGILGFTLFLSFLGFIFIRIPFYHTFLLAPLILYGLTHQNFRNTAFWVFLAACYAHKYFTANINHNDSVRDMAEHDNKPRQQVLSKQSVR